LSTYGDCSRESSKQQQQQQQQQQQDQRQKISWLGFVTKNQS